MEDDLTLYEYWTVFRRHWRLTLILPMLFTATALAVTVFLIPRRYQASTTILVQQAGSQSSVLAALASNLPFSGAGVGGAGGQTALDTYRAILKSRRVREALVSDFGLVRFFAARDCEHALRLLERSTTVSVSTKANSLIVNVELAGTPMLHIAGSRRSNDVGSRQLTAALANAYVQHLAQYLRDNTIYLAQRNRIFVAEQKSRAELDLRQAETALLAYQAEEGVVSVPEETKALIERRASLTADKTRVELEAKQAEARAQLLHERLLAQAEAGITDPFPDAQVAIEETRKQLAQLEIDLAVKSDSLADTHPDVVQLHRQITETKARLKEQLARIYATAEKGLVSKLIDSQVALAGAEASLSGLKQALSKVEAPLAGMPAKALGVAQLQRQVAVRQQVYELLSTEYERARIEEAREVPRFEVLDSASTPLRKSSPSLALNLGMGFLVGLFVAVIAAFCFEAGARATVGGDTGTPLESNLARGSRS